MNWRASKKLDLLASRSFLSGGPPERAEAVAVVAAAVVVAVVVTAFFLVDLKVASSSRPICGLKSYWRFHAIY